MRRCSGGGNKWDITEEIRMKGESVISSNSEIFTTRVEQRRVELQLDNGRLLGIIAGLLLGVCSAYDIDALELAMKAMEAAARDD